MSRDFIIYGETLARVTFGGHVLSSILPTLTSSVKSALPTVYDLGLCLESVRVRLNPQHVPVKSDDFGKTVNPEIMTTCSDVFVDLGLIHYDRDVVNYCLCESIGGVTTKGAATITADWSRLLPAGTLLGHGLPLGSSGNHFIGLYLLTTGPTSLSPTGTNSYFFPSCYLTGQPAEIPIGAERSLARLQFRAIPYTIPNGIGEVSASGSTVWQSVENTAVPGF